MLWLTRIWPYRERLSKCQQESSSRQKTEAESIQSRDQRALIKDVAYRRSRCTNNDSDEQDASQELLASPSPPTEKETLEDDSIEPIDHVEPVVPDSILRDIVVLGQRRRPSWVRQTL